MSSKKMQKQSIGAKVAPTTVLGRLQALYRVDTVSGLAAAMDTPEGTVKGWSRRDSVPLEHLLKAADEHGVTLDWLCGRETHPDKAPSYVRTSKVLNQSGEFEELVNSSTTGTGGYALEAIRAVHEVQEPSGPLETARRQALLADYLACDEEGQRAIEHLTRVMAGARSPEKEAQPTPALTVRDLRQAQDSLNAEVSRIALNLNLVDSDRLRQVSVGIDHLLEHGEWPALNPGPRPAFVRAPIGAQSATAGTGGHQSEIHGSRERGAATNKGLHTGRSGGTGGPRR